MFSSFDKALAAVVMGGLYLLNAVGGVDVGLTEDQVSAVLSVLTPVIVWLVPNRNKA